VLFIFLVSGILNAGYFFPIIIRGFFYAPSSGRGDHDQASGKGEASAWMVAPLCGTAFLAVLFGIMPDFPLPFFELARTVAEAVTGPAMENPVNTGIGP
jgi:multicomponent Na+:H+ antiporter subunit D